MDQYNISVETVHKISQAVSLIPILVAIVVLYVGGSAGSWFIVEEYYAYSATDEDANQLVTYSDYNFYLNEVGNVEYLAGPDKTGTSRDSVLTYDSDGYEQRSSIFYNLGLLLYATMFIALLCSISIFVLDYLWHEIIKNKLLPGIGKNDILAALFGGYLSVIVFVVFLALYASTAIPAGMYEDHYGTDKACLYQEDITIVGNVEACEGEASNERAQLYSKWTIGPGFIIFVAGVLVPSVYLLSTTYQRFEEVVEKMDIEEELFFDSEGRLLFDVNTGEIVASYVDDDRELFYDEDTMTLFEESTGEILYAPSGSSEPEPESEPESEPEPEPEPEVVSAEVVESEPVEAEAVVAEVVEAEPIDAKGKILDAEPVEAELVEDTDKE